MRWLLVGLIVPQSSKYRTSNCSPRCRHCASHTQLKALHWWSSSRSGVQNLYSLFMLLIGFWFCLSFHERFVYNCSLYLRAYTKEFVELKKRTDLIGILFQYLPSISICAGFAAIGSFKALTAGGDKGSGSSSSNEWWEWDKLWWLSRIPHPGLFTLRRVTLLAVMSLTVTITCKKKKKLKFVTGVVKIFGMTVGCFVTAHEYIEVFKFSSQTV